MKLIFTMPLYVTLKSGKKYIINKNNERNWHYYVSNKVKKAYQDLAFSQLYRVKLKPPISLEFTYFKGSLRRSDRSNVLSQHEKFFCDALVNFKCIPDDNDNVILSTHYYSGGLDRENPRVEIRV